MNAMPVMLLVLAILAIAYRFYSSFLAAQVAVLDDSRITPAHRLNDGQNYHPTNRWVLFGHHFAAISGAGPLIGPVLAIQFGYMPGLVWLVVGVCLAGAVQDMLVLWASTRTDGKSLAEITRATLGPFAGTTASVAILFIVIIALSGLGIIVVKALGGEEVKMPAGTKITFSKSAGESLQQKGSASTDPSVIAIPPDSTLTFPNGSSFTRSEGFVVKLPKGETLSNVQISDPTVSDSMDSYLILPAGTNEQVRGSSWGVFTIACTIPIALFVGLYMYRIRKGHVVEASLLGAVAVLFVTVAGSWIPGSPLEPYFTWTRDETIFAICAYGFVASVLPVWLLLCPRDYLSSFLKVGTIGVLIIGVLIANPKLEAPAINAQFANGGGPYFNGAIFPFVFICIMCGAVSGFHALVASGTTPKMIGRESDIRMIGYGSMLLEGLVAITALLAAATLPQGDYWAINIDLSQVEQFAGKLQAMGADTDHLVDLEKQVGGETLRGRTGGAVTLAVGMARIMTDATRAITTSISIDGVIKYWYHFAIMFEALFILTTIDTGTRIARFLFQEILGKIFPAFEKVDWLPGVLLSSSLVTIAWGGLIWSGSIQTIWPMFGIANQLLSGIALTIVTTYLIQQGRGKYAWVTLIPMLFVVTTTLTAGSQMIMGPFASDVQIGWNTNNWSQLIRGTLCITGILFLLSCFTIIVVTAVTRWFEPQRKG